MPLTQEELPSPIQTSDADLGSGPETAESLISGPQSANTEASVKTEVSIKPETSKAASGDDSGNRSASPSASLQGFLLTDSPRGTASCNGSGSDAAAAASASVPTRSVMRQREEENDDDAGDCAETASSQAEGADQDSALAGALRAPRRGTGVPRDTQVSKEPAEDAAPTAVPGEGRGSGLAHNSVERAAEGKGEDWGGQSEGMFRKRVSFELKAMLALNGGTCTMQALAATFKRHRHRLLNLQGKKLRVLLTTGSGLYGIGLYGTGQDAIIKLEDNRAAMSDNSVPPTDPDSVGRQSGTKHLTRTFVNPDALRNGESPRGRSAAHEPGNEGRGSSYDRPGHKTRNGDRRNSPREALRSTPAALGSRNTLGYANTLAEPALRGRDFPSAAGRSTASTSGNQHVEQTNLQRGGRSRVGRGRSRSLGRHRSRSRSRHGPHAAASRGAAGDGWTERAEGGSGWGGHFRQGYRRARSPSDHKRFSHTARRDSPRRRSSPPLRRGRSPSPRSSRGLNRNRRMSHSRSPRRNSSPPNRRGSPRRRGSSPKRSPQRSAEPGRSRRSRADSKDKPSATRGRNGSTRRDRGSPSPAAKGRRVAEERSAKVAEDGDASTRRDNGARQAVHHGRQQGSERVPPRDYRAGSSAAGGVEPVGYAAKAIHGAPREAARAPENGRGAVVVEPAVGMRMIDPIIPLALGGAPIPPVAAVPGTRLLMEGAAGGGGGFPARDGPPTKHYHTATGNGDEGYPVGNGGMPRGWPRRDGGGIQEGGGGGLLAPNLAPAMLPPLSSLRPLPLPAGCAQGARLMIKGTHPAVPERRIHALVSTFGIVGKIEVLEGFVFVHMKSIEEALRAVAGLNGKIVPHVSPQVNNHAGPPPPHLVAAIWREEHYLALMSKENMRAYADTMRKASTWYERQTKSGFMDTRGERMPCRFFALGRGCIFGNACGFSHESGPPPYPRGPANTHGSAGGLGFDQPLPKPQRLLPNPAFEPGPDARAGVPPLSYRQERIPVLALHGQSPTLTFVHRDETDSRPGHGPQGGHKPAYAGNAVGVAMPWQPEHGAGTSGASLADRTSPHLGTSTGSMVDRGQPNIGRDSSKVLGNSEPQHGPRRTFAAARANAPEGNQNTRRSGYHDSSRGHEGSTNGDRGGGGGRGGDGGSRREGSRTGSEKRSPRSVQHGRSRSRERGGRRDRESSPVSSRSGSPRRSSGGFEKSGGSRVSVRDAGRQRGRDDSRRRKSESHESAADRGSRKQRRDSRSRRSKSHESTADRGSRKHRRENAGRRSKSHESAADRGSRKRPRNSGGRRSKSHVGATDRRSRKHGRDSRGRQQYRASRSSSRGRRLRDDSGDRHGRSSARRDRTHRNDRSRGSVSPVGKERRDRGSLDRSRVKARRYGNGSDDSDADGRRAKNVRHERVNGRGDSRNRGRREEIEEERDSFLGRGGDSNGRREDMSVNHGWVSLANDPGGFSREGQRQGFGVSPPRVGGSAPLRDDTHQLDDLDGQFGVGEWSDGFMKPEVPARPVKTQFTVTARLGSLQPPPVPGPAASRRSTTKFSITMPPSMTGALVGPTSPPGGGVRRGGRPARGRGRGGRVGNQRDTGGRRSSGGPQYDNAGYNHFE